MLIEEKPEGDGDHTKAEEPEEEVNGEDEELEAGVAAVESHLGDLYSKRRSSTLETLLFQFGLQNEMSLIKNYS